MDDPTSTEIHVTTRIQKPTNSTTNKSENSILQRRTWTSTETMKLLECYIKRLNEMKRYKRLGPIYERIVEDMERMNVLKKPLTPVNIASKMKGMKKAYFRSIGANILEIPNCVRPFLKEMNKICGVNGLEGGDRNDSYAEPSDEKLSDFEKDGDSTRINDSYIDLSNSKQKSPRRWVTSEIRELLKCLLRHKLEYLRTFDKMAICKRILKDLIIKRALKKPTTSSMISQKILELRNGFSAVRCGRQEPTNYVKIFMKQLQQIFGMRTGRRTAANSIVKPNSVKGPEQHEQKIPLENGCPTSESQLIKLEFIKLEAVPSTTICGEIHRCSETQLLSFVCTICREPFTDVNAYSSHLIYHFGVASMAIDNTANEHDIAADDKNMQSTITELPEDEILPNLQQINFESITSEPSINILHEKSSFVSNSLNNQPQTNVNIPPARESTKRTHCDTNVSSKTIKSVKVLKRNISIQSTAKLPKEPVNFKCCKICRQEFDTLADYERHIKAEYEENNMLICPYVSRGKSLQNKRCHRKTRYTSYCMLSRHLRVGHGKYPQLFKCQICSKNFKSPKGLEYHLPMHTGDWRYQCDICKKSFSLLSYLEIHMRFHTGEKPELCTKCGQGFSTKSGLALHMRKHNGDLKRHPCTVCGQRFKFPNELLDHIRVHTGDKPYACTLCAKPYRSKKLVRQHELMHNPEKKHACRFCDLMFKQSSNRNLHERQKHKIV